MVARLSDRRDATDWRIATLVLAAHALLFLWLLLTRIVLPAPEERLHVSFGEARGNAAAAGADRSLGVAPPRVTATRSAAPVAVPRPEGRLDAGNTATASAAAASDAGASGRSEGTGIDRAGGGRRPVFRAPRASERPLPAYPATAYLERKQGLVMVRARVSAQGRVLEAHLDTTSGTEALDVAAVDAVGRWTFTPATRDGTPIDADVIVPVEWHIGRDQFIKPRTGYDPAAHQVDPDHCDDNWMLVLSRPNNHVSPPNCLHYPAKKLAH